MPTLPLIGGLLLVMGLVVGVIGVRILATHLSRASRWRPDRATVVDFVWRGVSRTGPGNTRQNQYWTLERTDAYGRTHRARSTLGFSGGTLRRLPFDVDVLVDPHDESSFVLARGLRSGYAAIFFVLVGLLLAAGGAVFLWFALR